MAAREMKDSGLEWVKQIPKDFRIEKLKFHLKRRTTRNPGNKEVLSLYRDYGVIPKDSREDNHNVTSLDTSNYLFVRNGDFVINKMKAWQGSVATSEYEGIVSPAYFVYEFTSPAFNKKYFHYLLRSCYRDEFRRLSGGIREGQWDLPANAFENSLCLIPPIEEQKSIALFIDSKCAEIDALTTDIEKQIKTLQEYKKSVITEAVTKGLDPNVEMKECEVAWIGTVPKLWKLKPLKYCVALKTNKSKTNNRYIGLEHVKSWGGTLLPIIDDEVNFDGDALSFTSGDVLFGKLRPYLAKCFLADIDGCCSTEFLVMTPLFIEKRYLKFIFLTSGFIDTVNMSTDGVKMPRANWNFIGSMKVPMPSQAEQTVISDFLDAKCAEIDATIEDKQKQLEILGKYKKSLIYEVVTGKKEIE